MLCIGWIDIKGANLTRHSKVRCQLNVSDLKIGKTQRLVFGVYSTVDFDTIHGSDALAYLRTNDRFEKFVKNSYQIPRYLPEEQDEKLDIIESEKATDLLDQIASLGALYEKGVLTPDEFQEQKQKLLYP